MHKGLPRSALTQSRLTEAQATLVCIRYPMHHHTPSENEVKSIQEFAVGVRYAKPKKQQYRMQQVDSVRKCERHVCVISAHVLNGRAKHVTPTTIEEATHYWLTG